MKIDPMPKRVTLPRLATGFNQLHQCLEDHREKTDRSLDRILAFITPFENFARLVSKYGRWLVGVTATAVISVWVTVILTAVLHVNTDRAATAAAQQAKAATAQGQYIAQAVGAPVVPTPKTPSP